MDSSAPSNSLSSATQMSSSSSSSASFLSSPSSSASASAAQTGLPGPSEEERDSVEARGAHAGGDSEEEGARWVPHSAGRGDALERGGRKKKKSESDLRRAARRAEQRARQLEAEASRDAACAKGDKGDKRDAAEKTVGGKKEKTDQVDQEEQDMLRLSRAGDLDGVKRLLGVTQGYTCAPDRRFLLNCKDSLQRTALHLAAFEGHRDLVRLLLRCGASPKVGAQDGLTPLHFAAQKGHAETVEMLLRGGANVNALVHRGRRSALHFACKNGHLNAALLLVQYGGDLNLENAQGETPLKDLSEEIQGLLRQAATVAVRRSPGSDKSKQAGGKSEKHEKDDNIEKNEREAGQRENDGKDREAGSAEHETAGASRMIGPLMGEEAARREGSAGRYLEDDSHGEGDIRRKREREEGDDEHENKKERRTEKHEERARPTSAVHRPRMPVICAAQDDEDEE
ncbi:ankyrin repeat-containing protein [Toxoplasma gondii ME49]|uniref:Ankyrin repeat-containing protein n=2 Tax=Toxoplasma gondii TaxID=5811 RepID=A0A086M044_TOXGO|nr:ankyrin repeat-containing protein [Toxoplasma gondii ME49]EPT26537.1 ankyrin repeat-containing protein [Toxoplasma gondii ME49]KFG62262.1 ankyrin repeat-containing protein [Toxoplasma gondii RUB]|eukprot:XP_018635734.1 ankyrin repeat-containing protein [Toxoplasma gondii ME49]